MEGGVHLAAERNSLAPATFNLRPALVDGESTDCKLRVEFPSVRRLGVNYNSKRWITGTQPSER